MANGFYIRKSWDMAAPEYEKYLEQYLNAPGRQTALFRLGECYRTMATSTEPRTATRRLSPVLRPASYWPGWHSPGRSSLQDGDFSGALPLYRKATIRMKQPAVINAAKYYTARCLEIWRTTTMHALPMRSGRLQ